MGLASCQDDKTFKRVQTEKFTCAILKEACKIQKIKSSKKYCILSICTLFMEINYRNVHN